MDGLRLLLAPLEESVELSRGGCTRGPGAVCPLVPGPVVLLLLR